MSLDFGKEESETQSKQKYNKTATQNQTEQLNQTGTTTGTTNTTGTQTSNTVGTQTGQTVGTALGTNTSTVNPWATAQPYLENYLGMLGGVMPQVGQTTEGQQGAIDQLRQAYATGPQNPYAEQTGALVDNLMNTVSRAGDVGTAYADYARRLEGTAAGSNLNLTENPYIQQMLQKATDDAVTRTNEMFAGAGRSFSGANQRGIGQAVAEAQNPILAELYRYEQGRTDAAGRDLYSGAINAANTQTALDAAANQARASGLNVASAGMGLADQNYAQGVLGAQDAYSLESQLRNLGISDLTQLGGLLTQTAGLGQTATGTSEQQTAQNTAQQTAQQSQVLTQQQQEQQLTELINKILQAEGKMKEKGTTTGSSSTDSSSFGFSLAPKFPSF